MTLLKKQTLSQEIQAIWYSLQLGQISFVLEDELWTYLYNCKIFLPAHTLALIHNLRFYMGLKYRHNKIRGNEKRDHYTVKY